MGGPQYRLAACALVLGVGCSSNNAEPSLSSVSPDLILAGQEALVTIHGGALYADVEIDLSGKDKPELDENFQVGIGPLALDDVRYVNGSQLQVTVPPTLAVGLYDLQLTLPGGDVLQLEDALEVVRVLPMADAGPVGADAGLVGEPVTNFSDDFDDAEIDSRWTELTTTSGCSMSESGGALRFSIDGNTACNCEVRTDDGYDLRATATAIHIPPITNFYPELRSYMRLTSASGDTVEYGFNNDTLYLSVIESAVETDSITTAYDASVAYWRIREGAGELFFETSIDLSSWQVAMQRSAPFGVEYVRVSVGVSTSGPMAAGVGISVLSYNIVQ